LTKNPLPPLPMLTPVLAANWSSWIALLWELLMSSKPPCRSV